jgi:hypothetical protein
VKTEDEKSNLRKSEPAAAGGELFFSPSKRILIARIMWKTTAKKNKGYPQISQIYADDFNHE